jgi:predicted metalloprotease with PDZ domain
VRARLTLPAGFEAATALRPGTREGAALVYDPVTLNVLQDSPVFAGRYVKRFDLAPGAKVPVMLNVFADNPRYLEAKPAQIEAHRRLLQQAYKVFGSQHYDHYDFLLSLSSRMGGIGLEHHRSSENGVAPEYFTEWDTRAAGRDLLPHEFTHSWNGKFRRPADLATPNFNVPMQDSLLWVYEGQTQYWGNVLAARSGLLSAAMARDALALVAMTYSVNRPGFAWRNVQDTTNDPIIAQRKPQSFTSWQLSEDYYVAGQLIWLATDARLRTLSRGKRSLDDFAKAFFGVDDGRWTVKPYTFDDVAATLEQVQPTGDWAAFLRTRLDANAAPLDGLAAAGWELVFDDTPNPYLKQVETIRKFDDFTAMIGLVMKRDGSVAAVRWDSPGFDAGLAVGDQVLAVDGRAYTAEDLRDAIRAAKGTQQPITLLVKDGAVYRSVALDYHDGLRYPHLKPIAGGADWLDAIYAPRK